MALRQTFASIAAAVVDVIPLYLHKRADVMGLGPHTSSRQKVAFRCSKNHGTDKNYANVAQTHATNINKHHGVHQQAMALIGT